MFCMLKKIKIYPAYVSKHNTNCEKQVIILMIENGEKQALVRGITSKHYVGFLCLFRKKSKLKLHKKYVKIDFCNVIITSENILNV